jgi:hypothetical protein
MLAKAQRQQITMRSPGHRSPPQDEDSELERKLQKAVTALQRWRQKFEMEVAANKELGRRVRSWKQLCEEESCKRDAAEAALQAADVHFNEQLRECLQTAATEKAVLEAEVRACKRQAAQDRRAAARIEAALEAQILQLQLSLQGCGRNDAACRTEPVTPVTKPARPTAELRPLSALRGSSESAAAAVPAPPSSSSSSGSGSGVRQSGPRRRQHSAVTPLQVTPLQDTNLWSSPIKSAAAAERSGRQSSGTCKRLLSSLELSSDNSSCGGATARFAAVLDSTAESWCDNGRACSDSDSDTAHEHTAGVDAPLSVTRSLDSGGGNFSSDDDCCSDSDNSYTCDSYSRACGATNNNSNKQQLQLQLDSPLRAGEQQLRVLAPGCDSPNDSDVPPLALQMSYVSASSQSLSLSPPPGNGMSRYGGASPYGESLLQFGANLQFECTEQGPVKQQLAVCVPSVAVERNTGSYERKQRGSSGDVNSEKQQHSHSWSVNSDSNGGSSSGSSTGFDSSFTMHADPDNDVVAGDSSAAAQVEHDELGGSKEPHSDMQQQQQHTSLVQRGG